MPRTERPTPSDSRNRRRYSSWRRVATPGLLKRAPVVGLTTAMDRLCARGEKTTARRIARLLVLQIPRSAFVRRQLVRVLLHPPIRQADLAEARKHGQIMLAIRATPRDVALFAEVLIATQRYVGDSDAREALLDVASSMPTESLVAVRRYVSFLFDSGQTDEMVATLRDLTELSVGDEFVGVQHEFLVRSSLMSEAMAVEQDAWSRGRVDPDLIRLLTAARLSANGDESGTLDELSVQRPSWPRERSLLMVSTLVDTGRHSDALHYLDQNHHNLHEDEEALYRFSCLVSIGDLDGAREAAIRAVEANPSSAMAVRRYAEAERICGNVPMASAELVRALETAGELGPDDLSGLYFETDQVDDVLRVTSASRTAPAVGWLGEYNAARAHYVKRDFEAAKRHVERTLGSPRHWEGVKLRARVALEEGRFDDALADRARNQRGDELVDEVAYFSHLNLGRYREAFSMYASRRDRQRLRTTFGERAEFGPEFDDVESRFIISQNGPGDEIQLASLLPALKTATTHLTMTCDPRLLTLLSRSFPDVDFVPVVRLKHPHHPGFLLPTHPDRAQGALYDLLTADALDRARTHDRIVLSRSLQPAALLFENSAPFGAYVVAEQRDSPPWRNATSAPLVGVAWRSELNDAMRSIHYLRARDIRGLEALGRLVCLQHDVTEDERRELLAIDPNAVFLDDVDLRNDFESTATVLDACDVVVGVGTTMTELSAAVGRPTVFLEPNRFGAWRASGAGCRDFWHQSALVAVAPDPVAPAGCVRRAVELMPSARAPARPSASRA